MEIQRLNNVEYDEMQEKIAKQLCSGMIFELNRKGIIWADL